MCVKIKIQKYTETVTETDRQTVGGNIIQISAGQQTIPSGCDATFRDSSKNCSTSSLWWTKAKLQTSSLLFTVYSYGLRFTVPGRALELRLPVPAAAARELHCAAVAQTDTFSFSLSLSSAVCQSVFPSSCLFVCLSVRQSVSWLLAQSATPAAPQTAAAASVAWRLVNFKLSVHTPGAHREAGTTLWGQIARRAATN